MKYSGCTGATQMLAKAASHMFDIKTRMGGKILHEKQENELRELHQWAMTTLHQIQQVQAACFSLFLPIIPVDIPVSCMYHLQL